MLKLLLLFAVLMGASEGRKFDSKYYNEIKQDLNDFIDVVPWDKINTTIVDHLQNDVELQAALNFMQSKKFKLLLKSLKTEPSMQEIHLKFLKAGLDLEHYEKIVADVMGGMEFSVEEDTDRSFESFLYDIARLIPFGQLDDLMDEKFNNSLAFMLFYRTITSEEMCSLFKKTMHSREFNTVAVDLQSMDVPVYVFLDVLFYSIFECSNGLNILEIVFDDYNSDESF